MLVILKFVSDAGNDHKTDFYDQIVCRALLDILRKDTATYIYLLHVSFDQHRVVCDMKQGFFLDFAAGVIVFAIAMSKGRHLEIAHLFPHTISCQRVRTVPTIQYCCLPTVSTVDCSVPRYNAAQSLCLCFYLYCSIFFSIAKF